MATILSNAVNFLGKTLKQALTPDNLRDYRHANKLFVGSNFRLNPKNNFLFYVYFDINDSIASNYVSQKNSRTEIGLMCKTADLPKFTVDTKMFNSYNRPNIVQSKIRFDPVGISFHDDNANVVRNFWYDYYTYYYRDSDYAQATYGLDYKYQPQTSGKFGYSKRRENQRPYLRCIRLYSLHQKAFSEYILINPIIKTFKHGQHSNNGESGIMQHDMVIEYENILYSDGYVTVDNPIGFATLHYDLTASPLGQAGGVKSIFGRGGLMDTAGSVLSDLQQGNFLSAAFKAARGINAAKGMNLKKSFISELTSIYTQEASAAIVGAINNNMTPNRNNGYTVPTVGGVSGAVSNRYTGIESTTSVAALAGAALLLNSTPIINKNTTIRQSNAVPPPSNYNPRLPANPGASYPESQNSELTIANNRPAARQPNDSSQKFDATERRLSLDQSILNTTKKINSLNDDLSTAQKQFATTNSQISNLNTRLSAAQAATPPIGVNITAWNANKEIVVNDLKLQIQQATSLRTVASNISSGLTQSIKDETLVLESYSRERRLLD
jgi:hypothetical protein